MTRVSPELAKSMIEKSHALSAHESFEGCAPVEPKLAKAVNAHDKMNDEERKFAQHLSAEVLAGNIARWWFQPWKFLLADKCSYTPDFVILHNDRTLEIADVKAYWKASKKALAKNAKAKGGVHVEDDAKVKAKVAARMWPVFRWTYRYRLDGDWKSEDVKP